MNDDRWTIYSFPNLPDELIVAETVQGAIASRAESGAVYWDAPNPRRSYVRGAIYDGSGRLINLSQRKGGMNSDMVLSVNPPVLSRRERGEAIERTHAGRWLYAGSWMHGFGHFLVETLPTLWPLLEDPRGFDGICAHRFNSLKTFDWQFEIVGLLSSKPIHVIDDDPSRYAELVVPARTYHYQVAIHPVATRVWDLVSSRAAEGASDSDGPSIYLSRSRFQAEQLANGVTSGREVKNSEAVDDVFAAFGFRVVYPETLAVTEQIRLARQAPIVAGAAGSALHLSVFTKPGARVIELGDTRTGSNVVATQRAISSAKRQPTAHIAYAEATPGSVDLDHLRSRLRELLA